MGTSFSYETVFDASGKTAVLAAYFIGLLAMVPFFSITGVFVGPVATALGGVAAVVSGLQAEEHIAHGDAVHRVMETHELLAFVTLGTFGVLALCAARTPLSGDAL